MIAAHGCWAVVPVKEAAEAKTRLAQHLAPAARIALARAMVEDVLGALAGATGLAGIAVVTLDPHVIELARRFGAHVFSAGARDGHTGAVATAVQRLSQRLCGSMLTVPGDIPAVTVEEITRVLRAHRRAPSFTICPAHDRRGSNAVMLSSPAIVPLAFGNDSFLPHLAAARARGIEPTIVDDVPGIARDIDTAEDIEALFALPGATGTKKVLEQYGWGRGELRLSEAASVA